MRTIDWFPKVTQLAIVVFLAMIALRPYIEPPGRVLAQGARFDHVYVISPSIGYKGGLGVLVMDRRNGNVWFIPKKEDAFQEPVFVIRVPFEKLDQAPQ
jgi:hypothetical protein